MQVLHVNVSIEAGQSELRIDAACANLLRVNIGRKNEREESKERERQGEAGLESERDSQRETVS